MSQRRPYLKFLIAGGVVCAEGGSLLPSGLEFLFLMGNLPSNILRGLGITFTVIGAVSLCIGLSLLYKGVQERNQWLYTHGRSSRFNSTYLDEDESQERSMIREKLPVTKKRSFCVSCGTAIPDLPNVRYCPKCGEDLY